MPVVSHRLRAIWRKTFSLGWPVALQQSLNTLMRTVDILITGFFSPAAVAAIGLADLYARIPLRLGKGLGSGAIAIASQETGRDSHHLRNQAISQALLIGALSGIPFVILGGFFGHTLIAILGAESAVVTLGGIYLMIIFAVAPMRIVGFVGANAMQGTGDTRTPMAINALATILNILLSIILGLGIWFVPTYGIIGVGIATAIARTLEAGLFLAIFMSNHTTVSLSRPTDFTVARQILQVSGPDIAGGFGSELARFPFNALLLLFGTEANAAYHIANRLYQQFTAAIYRAFRTVATILVGQELGAGRADDARYTARAICSLSIVILFGVGLLLFIGAGPLALLFTREPLTVLYATEFNRVFALSMLFIAIYFPFAGALRGAGDTKTPFYAQLTGSYVFLLGISYLLAISLGFGLIGVYLGIISSYAARAAIVTGGFYWGSWPSLAERMIAEREAIEETRDDTS